MPSIEAEDPVTGFSLDPTDPGDAVGSVVSAVLGMSIVLMLFGIASNGVVPFVRGLISDTTGGAAGTGEPALGAF